MKTITTIVTATAISSFALLNASCEKKTVVSSDQPVEETPAAVAGSYPLQTCVVSGEKLGEMGKPYVFEHEGTTVKLCCKSCLVDFNKEPEKYIGMIKDAQSN